MSRQRMSSSKECSKCKRTVSDSFLCRRCGRELRELLIGDGTVKPVVEDEHSKRQPGIIWYIGRLRETAYRQARMAQGLGAKSSHTGYYLFGNHEAAKLLAKIRTTLAYWSADLDRLVAPHRHDDDGSGVMTLPEKSGGLDAWRATYLAEHIPELRHRCKDIGSLHADMLGYARDAWRIINRPSDICCGPCPNLVEDEDKPNTVKKCEIMLYAEEFAEEVQCPKCRARHDVLALREELKRQTRDKLFTGSQLLRLMETRLNDKVPKSTFYKLISDGRLLARGWDQDKNPMYTYADVCEAREKPVPGRKSKSA